MLRIATRGSPLARWQAEEVARLLVVAHPRLEVELVVVDTAGDRRVDVPLWEMGGQGIFVKEVQAALLDHRADVAVHSAKDLPSTTAPELALSAVPQRGDPRDALVGAALDDLGPGAIIATGSVRRRAQLAWLRPDLAFTGLRGNIESRLGKIPPGGAVVVAAAALSRLGLLDRAAQILDPIWMLPQVGQGAMAVECLRHDEAAGALLAAIDDPAAHAAIAAERAFLARLGTGCDLPAGAYATVDPDGTLTLEGLLATADGRVLVRDRRHGPAANPPLVGEAVADALLVDAGGGAMLAGVEAD